MKWIATLLLAAYLLNGCQAVQPELYVSVNADCSGPCWYGVMPGKSTLIETESVLRSLQFVAGLDFGTASNQDKVVVSWRFTQSTASGSAIFKNGLLQQLIINPKGLSLGEIIDRIGFPDHIVAGYEPVEAVVYDLILYYPKKGIVITVADSPVGGLADAQRITRDLNIAAIQYFAPMNLETFLIEIDGRSRDSSQSVLEHLQAWPGYGSDVVHIGK